MLLILSKTWWRALGREEENSERALGLEAEQKSAPAEVAQEVLPPLTENVEEEEGPEEGAEEEPTAGETETVGEETPFVDDDVPTTAYDLDMGRPIERERTGHALPWKGRVRNAKEFFSEEILYRFDLLQKEDRGELAGSYRIELKGYHGGVWSLVVGDDLQVVNRREEGDVVLIMQQRDFISLVNGDINPQLAILAQKVKVTGDIRKASLFQALLFPAGE
jgi:putative sterol carrier protein